MDTLFFPQKSANQEHGNIVKQWWNKLVPITNLSLFKLSFDKTMHNFETVN
jgi:hypothetical protein